MSILKNETWIVIIPLDHQNKHSISFCLFGKECPSIPHISKLLFSTDLLRHIPQDCKSQAISVIENIEGMRELEDNIYCYLSTKIFPQKIQIMTITHWLSINN